VARTPGAEVFIVRRQAAGNTETFESRGFRAFETAASAAKEPRPNFERAR
jgi:hypothetical protein